MLFRSEYEDLMWFIDYLDEARCRIVSRFSSSTTIVWEFSHGVVHPSGPPSGIDKDPGTSNTIGGLGGVPSNARWDRVGNQHVWGMMLLGQGMLWPPHFCLAAYLGLVAGCGGSLALWMGNHLQTLALHHSPSVPFPRRRCALRGLLLWCECRKFSTKSTRVWRLRPIKPRPLQV